jgi:flagellar hook-associated protein 2
LAANYVDVTVQPGAAIQDFTVSNITQLARQTKQQTGDFVLADSTTADAVTGAAGFFTAGTVNLRAVDGTAAGVPVTLTAGDSLQAVVNKFNAVKDRTGIQASLLTVSTGSGSNSYKIIYSSTQTGSTYGFDLSKTSPAAGFGVVSDPSGVLTKVTSAAGFMTPQTAQNAQFDLDGVTVTRQSNAVSDVVSGVTFNLKQATSGVAINVSVKPDTSIVSNAVQSFVDAYNKFRLFASTQTQLGDNGLPLATAVLANNRTFQDIVTSVTTEVSSIVGGITSGHYSQLSDIGAKLDNFAGDATNPATQNILTLDTDKLNSSLTANFDQVRSVFEGQLKSSNSNFVLYQSNNKFTANDLSVSINRTTKTYSATYTDPVAGHTTIALTGTDLSGGGITLTGPSGSALEGPTFL